MCTLQLLEHLNMSGQVGESIIQIFYALIDTGLLIPSHTKKRVLKSLNMIIDLFLSHRFALKYFDVLLLGTSHLELHMLLIN